MRRLIAAALVMLACATLASAQQRPAAGAPKKPAEPEKLIASLSRDRILIQSQFAGETLALFVVVADPPPGKSVYDAVVTVRGPRGAVSVRRKMQSGPLWLNLDNRKYIAIPAFLAVLANRDAAVIASEEVREDLRIGIQAQIPQQTAVRGANDPEFRAALQRIRENQSLFYEDFKAVDFITPNVLRTAITLPGTAPLGRYDIDIAVFNAGALHARKTLAFTVEKSGIEQIVYRLAHVFPLAYGILTALIALFFGWLASVIFRRD